MPKMLPELVGADCITRYENNPILSKKDIPYKADLIFNAGIICYHGKYYMIFRNDYLISETEIKFKTNVGIADSDDGIHWTPRKNTIELNLDNSNGEIKRFYDPRLTVIDDEIYACFAIDTNHGVRGGIGKVVGDFESIDVLSISVPDNRNMVLFPEKINGKYVRLERPFPVYSRPGNVHFDTWISKSPDLVYWGESELLFAVEDIPFANDKVGPGAPPVRTEYGWLVLYHSVDVDDNRGINGWGTRPWKKRYCIGVMFLDINDPTKIVGKCDIPLLVPETPYEVDEGFRTNVLFPGSAIVNGDDVKIYYGAADTVECLATAKLSDLAKLCNLK